MSLKNLSNTINGNKDEIIDTPAYIEITKKTLRFGVKIYQFHNITGFSLTCVDKEKKVPLAVIMVLFLYGAYIFIASSITSDGSGIWGILFVVLSVIGIVINEKQPLRYGFLLELNSGSKRIFITKDLEGVQKIVSKLYELMESETEAIYKINIDQRHASIGVGYAEKFKAKNVGGSIHNKND